MKEKELKLFSKEVFNRELKITESFHSRKSAYVTIFVILFSLIFFILRGGASLDTSMHKLIFDFISLLMCFCSIFSCFYLVKSWTGYAYAFPPLPSDLSKYNDKLKKQNNYDTDIIIDIIYNYYLQTASHNMKENERKGQNYKKLNFWLIITFVLVFIELTVVSFNHIRVPFGDLFRIGGC